MEEVKRTDADSIDKVVEADSLEWREAMIAEAKKQTPDTISDFIKKLESANHSYDSIVRASAIAAIAGASAIDNGKKGGITGFQAGFVPLFFTMIYKNITDVPIAIHRYDDLLQPYNEEKFTTISMGTWQWVVKEAVKRLGKWHDRLSEFHHLLKIISGEIPFGLKVKGCEPDFFKDLAIKTVSLNLMRNYLKREIIEEIFHDGSDVCPDNVFESLRSSTEYDLLMEVNDLIIALFGEKESILRYDTTELVNGYISAFTRR